MIMNTLQHRVSLLSLLLLSCTLMCEAKVVTSTEAATVANSFLSKSMTLREHHHRLLAPSQQTAAASAYHLFTGTDGRGFVIVAGDDVARPVLGYSSDAPVSADGTLPPAMQELLDDLESQIRQAQEAGAKQTAEAARQWQAAAANTGNTVVKLATATWGQGAPFNLQCPLDNGTRCVSGCVATAYAIMMKYYSYPTQGQGTTEAYTTSTKSLSVGSRNLNHSYDWSNMPTQYASGQYTTAQANSVAQLMADIGATFKMNYTTDNSTATLYQPSLFAHFGFNPGNYERLDDYAMSDWIIKIKDELIMKRPVVYRGANDSSGGHVFLLDGYTDQNYFSVNWGWGGNYNGFFTLSALTPGSYDYSSGQQACFDCVPFAEATTAETVAIVDGSTPCPSLEAAFGMSQEGKAMSIKLVKDTKTDNKITVAEGKVVTLDLNGHAVDTYGNITVRGKLTVKDNVGSGKISLVSSNIGVFSNNGELIIDGGTYENKVPSYTDSDYRRCVWSSETSTTHIKNGTFIANYQVCCFNGNATIDNGAFTCTGNSAVISKYNTDSKLVINGGTFSQTGEKPSSGTDYRRCVWTEAGSHTYINGGKFTCSTTQQAVCINGNALINSGSIVNKGSGSGLASGGEVKVNYCQISATTILRIFNDAKLKCAGGLYSQQVASQFLAEDCLCTSNTDAETKSVYPYKVYDPYASPAHQAGKHGDVNGDGMVDVADIGEIIDIMAGKEE